MKLTGQAKAALFLALGCAVVWGLVLNQQRELKAERVAEQIAALEKVSAANPAAPNSRAFVYLTNEQRDRLALLKKQFEQRYGREPFPSEMGPLYDAATKPDAGEAARARIDALKAQR